MIIADLRKMQLFRFCYPLPVPVNLCKRKCSVQRRHRGIFNKDKLIVQL